MRCTYTIGFQVDNSTESAPDGFVMETIPEVTAFTSQLTGPYRHLGNAWSAAIMRSRNGAFKQDRKVPPFEVYENEPHKVDENELVTTVHFPMK